MTGIYLSRLVLNLRRRDVQRDLADCHNMHRRLLSAFPDDAAIEHAREHFGMLYRLEQQGRNSSLAAAVLVQSRERPDWSRLPEGYLAHADVKEVGKLYQAIQPGLELRFRLRANPVKRIGNHNMTQREPWRGKRVDLRREEEQRDWLQRKGAEAGFALLAIRARPDIEQAAEQAQVAAGGLVHGSRHGAPPMTFRSVVFEGMLRVVDAERLRQALATGIGPGKAFGFGLLSVAPVAPPSE